MDIMSKYTLLPLMFLCRFVRDYTQGVLIDYRRLRGNIVELEGKSLIILKFRIAQITYSS